MPYQGPPVGYPSQPPQRGGNPLRLLLLGVVAVLAVGFFAFSLMNYLSTDEQAGPGPGPGPGPEPTSQGPTPEPTPEPTPVEIPDPDLNPPDTPVPTTWEEVDKWLVDNALYAETLQVPTNCPADRLDATTASKEQLQAHVTDLTACLTMVWLEPMERAGFQMPRPPAIVFDQPITTACGDAGSGDIFYCGGDQRIYYATDAPGIFPASVASAVRNPFFMASVIAHEYGHAVQARTGILISQQAIRSQSEKETDLELSRRKEMQADCFAGAFLHAVAQATQLTDAEHAALSEVTYAVGDDIISESPGYVGDHGTGAARQSWFEAGNGSAQVSTCNTWTAPADQVR